MEYGIKGYLNGTHHFLDNLLMGNQFQLTLKWTDIHMSNNPSRGLTYKLNLVSSNSCDTNAKYMLLGEVEKKYFYYQTYPEKSSQTLHVFCFE